MFPGEFLKLLWSKWQGDGSVPLWVKQTKLTFHVPVEEIRTWVTPDTDLELLADVGQRDVYTSPGLRRTGLQAAQQGSRRDVIALAGLVLDVDLASPGAVHKATNLPTEADLPVVLEGPDPTLVIHTGGGYHAWWLFEEPFDTGDDTGKNYAKRVFAAFQETYRKRAASHGWHLDDTSKISHVFRLPGTKNWKRPDAPFDIRVIYADGPRYRPTDLVPSIGRTKALDSRLGNVSRLDEPAAAPALNDEELEAKLAPVRAAMKRLSPNNPNRELMMLVLEGKSIAPAGERDRAMQRVVSVISWLTPARALESDVLAELLRPSLTVWTEEPDAERSIDEELDKAIEKFERAFDDRAKDDEKRAEQARVILKGLRFNGDEIPSEEAPDALLAQHAIIQKGSTFWVWDFGQQEENARAPGYYGPWTQTELVQVCRDAWEGAPRLFEIFYENAKGEEKTKTVSRLLMEYATAATDVLGHFSLQQSFFDIKTRVYNEAICPLRVTDAEFDAEIDTWLRTLGGAQVDKLLDWIAAVTQLDQQCALLYAEGPPGCGKNLLASGLARLWHLGGATPFSSIMGASTGGFNADMFKVPLIQLDEGLPDRFSNVSTFIRSLTGSSTHTYNEKFVVKRKVIGSVRLMITANNGNVLNFAGEEMGAADLEAVVGRFLHLEVSKDAAEWLVTHKAADPELTHRWVNGDRIARHALWLNQNRKLAPGRRFLVEGEATSKIHTNLITRGTRNGLVIEWIVRYLEDPSRVKKAHPKEFPRALMGDGKLLINTQAVVDGWGLYRGERNVKEHLTPQMIGRILNQLSFEFKPRLGKPGDRVQFHQINTDLILSWAEENQIGNIDKINDNLSSPPPEPFPESHLKAV